MTPPASSTTASIPHKENKIFLFTDIEKRYNWVKETTGHGTIVLTIQGGNIVFIETAIKEKP